MKLLLYSIFFFSGMSSLIAEITWNRMLVLVIGNTVMATSLLLVAFMGGLGFGSRWGSNYLRRNGSQAAPTLLPYCILEICIGIYILFSPLFFQPVSNSFSDLSFFYSNSTVLYFARFIVAFTCLFFPAFMMGATYPAIIAGSALEDSGRRVARTGYLYSINTLGAATGCLMAGYLLLPKLGAQLSLFVAFLFNISAALGAFVLYIANPRALALHSKSNATGIALQKHAKDIAPQNQKSQAHSFLRLVGIATFVIGFISLAYEVLLTRLVILFFGNQLIVFTLVLTAFLIGTGISALLGTSIHHVFSNTARMFGIITLAAGVFIVIPPIPFLYLLSTENTWLIQNQSLFVGLIMLVPIFFIGSLLPIAIRIYGNQGSGVRNQGSESRRQKTEDRSKLSREQTSLAMPETDTTFNAGKLYAWNTFGGMLGAGITNYFLVPAIGTQRVLTLFSFICIAIGLAVLWPLKKSTARWLLTAISVAALSIFVVNIPHKLEELYTSRLAAVSGGDIEPELKLHHEGRVATVTVIDFPWLGFRDMFLNGVEEASTRIGHVQLFKLLGFLPVAVHESDSPKEALMIAFGAGITAGAALGTGQISSLDVVDLNPDIEKINDLFKEVNGDVFHNPKFNFIPEDGRNYLLMNPKKYSVIISDSTHPRAYDSWILYTKEFYQDVKNHLLPGGVFAQWIPLSDFSLELYKIMLKTFINVFPNVTLWNIYGTDQAFLLATPSPFVLDSERLQNQLNEASASLQLKKYQMDKVVDIAGFFVMDKNNIERFIGNEKRINTDNLPYNQNYSLKKISPLRTQSFDRYQTNIRSYMINTSEKELEFIDKRQVLARTMYRFFFFSDRAALDEAFDIRPEDGNIMHYKKLEQQMKKMNAKKLQMDLLNWNKKTKELQKKIKNSPDNAENYTHLGKIYMDMNLLDRAENIFKIGLKYSPDSTSIYKFLGLIKAYRLNWGEATRMFELVLKREPNNNDIRDNLIRFYAEQNRHQEAIDLLLGKINSRKKSELEELGTYQDIINLAGSYFSLGNFKKAEEYLLNILTEYPGNTMALFHLSQVYKRQNRIKEAAEILNRILKINPYNKIAWQALGGFQGLDSP